MTVETRGLLVAAIAYAISWAIAAVIRAHAARLLLVQSSNERSSHVNPTASGGGLGIAVAGTIAGLAMLAYMPANLWFTLCGGAIAVTLGLLDDRFDLSSRLRLLVHFLLVGALIVGLGDHQLSVAEFGNYPSIIVFFLVTVAGVWWVNLFNFMDGIDGIAGSEAIFLILASVFVCASTGSAAADEPLIWWSIALAAACGGFLMMNWAPAKIFMGDAGSNYLAITIFSLVIITTERDLVDYPIWLILGAAFITDATVTLSQRMISGQNWFSAHRLHAYQKLSRRLNSHSRATLAYMTTNLLWLFPMAYFAHTSPAFAWAAVAVAYLPLVVTAFVMGAGTPEDNEV